ncbi:MAG: hypothetical protein JO218_15995 [Burkholderiales bacterium]|nr:hypothetical protein [Burkholderiales bacterium]
MRTDTSKAMRLIKAGLLGGALAMAMPASADAAADGGQDSPFKLQGFLTVVGGQVLSGSLDRPLVTFPNVDDKYHCPCYIADFANAGVYTKHLSFGPESHAGAQIDYTMLPYLTLTAQAIVRGNFPTPDLQWAYLDYKFDSHWNVHAGRQRIPLYYYSDFQDIGLAYPWISPPPEVYGWEATNYNGVSVRYHGLMGDISTSASIYGGDEVVHNDRFTRLLFSFDTTVKWHQIVGGNVEFNEGPWTLRSNIIHTKVTWNGPNSYDGGNWNQLTFQKMLAYGVTLNYDADSWFVLSEWDKQIRNNYVGGYTEKSPVWTLGGGMRFGPWTPFVNYSHYGDHYTYANLSNYPQTVYPNGGWSATLRYDIGSTSAVKVQYDSYWDQSLGSVFSGDAKVLRVSFDHVF